MDLTTIIRERFCVREFTEEKPSKEKIKAILEAGRLAPSWVNTQPWQFIVVEDKETIELLGELSFGQKHVANAQTIILCCGNKADWDLDNYTEMIKQRPNLTEERIKILSTHPAYSPKMLGDDAVVYRTLEQVTYATAYMTLEAYNQGLGAGIVGGIGNPLTRSNLDVYSKVTEKLGLPADVIICTMLVVGVPNQSAPEKSRKAFDEVVSYNKFGQKYS